MNILLAFINLQNQEFQYFLAVILTYAFGYYAQPLDTINLSSAQLEIFYTILLRSVTIIVYSEVMLVRTMKDIKKMKALYFIMTMTLTLTQTLNFDNSSKMHFIEEHNNFSPILIGQNNIMKVIIPDRNCTSIFILSLTFDLWPERFENPQVYEDGDPL